MVHGLLAEVRMMLWKDLMLLDVDEHGDIRLDTMPIPPLDMDALYDDHSNTQSGWNFL